MYPQTYGPENGTIITPILFPVKRYHHVCVSGGKPCTITCACILLKRVVYVQSVPPGGQCRMRAPPCPGPFPSWTFLAAPTRFRMFLMIMTMNDAACPASNKAWHDCIGTFFVCFVSCTQLPITATSTFLSTTTVLCVAHLR